MPDYFCAEGHIALDAFLWADFFLRPLMSVVLAPLDDASFVLGSQHFLAVISYFSLSFPLLVQILNLQPLLTIIAVLVARASVIINTLTQAIYKAKPRLRVAIEL